MDEYFILLYSMPNSNIFTYGHPHIVVSPCPWQAFTTRPKHHLMCYYVPISIAAVESTLLRFEIRRLMLLSPEFAFFFHKDLCAPFECITLHLFLPAIPWMCTLSTL